MSCCEQAGLPTDTFDRLRPNCVNEYLCSLMRVFGPLSQRRASYHRDLSEVADSIFRLLTSRPYNYLGRNRSEAYRARVLPWIEDAVTSGRPIAFYYDLGGGYRASLDPERGDLSFSVGLGELMALRQVGLFCRELREVYAAGAQFWIVIDNLCAYFTNDIPLERTNEYVAQLRRLIKELALDPQVKVLVESELFSVEGFRRAYTSHQSSLGTEALAPPVHENVCRFLGRWCEQEEALERRERYDHACAATERLLAPIVRGIRLTQRASAETLCFRSFPGGDQRIQTGSLAIEVAAEGCPKPILITTRNAGRYRTTQIQAPSCFPPTVREIVAAEPLVEVRSTLDDRQSTA